MAIFSLDDYQAFFSTTVPAAETNALAALCDAVGAAVEKYLGRPLERASRVEYYSPKGEEAIPLLVRPVWSVTEVRFDPNGKFGQAAGAFPASTVLTAGTHYYLDLGRGVPSYSGLLYAADGLWGYSPRRGLAGPWANRLTSEIHPVPGSLMVTYVGGFDPVPADILAACAQVTAQLKSMVKAGGPLILEKLGDSLYKRAGDELSAHPELGSARQILSRYREVPW